MSGPPLTLEFGLLGFLRQGPNHGYAIHQALSEPAGLGSVWGIKRGRLYALLARLEEAGYIAAITEHQENKPPRKVYHLTAAGEPAFLDWLGRPVDHGRSLRLEFLVKLYFARQEGPAKVAGLLEAQRRQCQEWLVAEQALVAEERARGRRYGLLVHQFRLGQIEAMLAWLEDIEGLSVDIAL